MTKVRFLMTTTVAGRRYAKGDVIDIDEDSARYLVALCKAKIEPEKTGANERTHAHDEPVKTKRGR